MLRSFHRTAALLFLAFACVAACAQKPLAPVPMATLTVLGAETSINSVWDNGPITVDFNGFVETVNYGQFSTPAALASGLAAMFCRDFLGMGLYAKAGAHNNQDPTVITFQLATGAAFGPLNIVGFATSFTFSSSGFANSSAGTVDIGVATLWFDGVATAKANYGDGSTGASIAQDLALTASSQYVTVTAEGQNLYLQSKRTGAYTDNYSVTFSTSVSFSSAPASGTLSSSAGDAAPRHGLQLRCGLRSGR